MTGLVVVQEQTALCRQLGARLRAPAAPSGPETWGQDSGPALGKDGGP